MVSYSVWHTSKPDDNLHQFVSGERAVWTNRLYHVILKRMKTCNISRIFSLVSMTVRSIFSMLSLPPLCPSSASPAPLWLEPPNMDCFLLRTIVDIIWPIPWMERFTFLPVDGGEKRSFFPMTDEGFRSQVRQTASLSHFVQQQLVYQRQQLIKKPVPEPSSLNMSPAYAGFGRQSMMPSRVLVSLSSSKKL